MKYILLLTLLSVQLAFAQGSVEQRRKQLFVIINEEITEVQRLSKQLGHRNPKLLMKVAELYLEKARLLKEVENREYLSIDPKVRSKRKKSSYFRESRRYFELAQKRCKSIIRRFGNFKGVGEVYYIMAFNNKEFGRNRQARKHLQKAVKYSRKNSYTNRKSKLALAEIYYNEQNYKRAIPLYREILSKKENKWWTKDAFNYAWALYRTNRFTDAINLMNEIKKLSKTGKFVDMSVQVNRDLGIFYAESGRIKDSLKFYGKEDSEAAKNLIKVAKILMDRGKATKAEKVLIEAKKYAQKGDRIEVSITLLGLYERFGKYGKHLTESKALYEIHKKERLGGTDFEVFQYQLERVGGKLQKQVLAKTYRKNRKLRRLKAQQASEYFGMLSTLSRKDQLKFSYLQGETLFAAGLYVPAFTAYERSFTLAQKLPNQSVMKGSLEGMLTVLGKRSVPKKIKDQHLLSTYNKYLSLDRRSKRANSIYQRLFKIYYDKGDLDNASKVMMSYRKNFPREIPKQEAMLAKIIDTHRKKKDRKAVKQWADRIRSGQFKVNPKYAKQLTKILAAMQFEGVEKASSKGDKKAALVGYIQIFNDKDSGDSARANAAHNIAVLYFDLGYPKEMYKWSNTAIDQMKVKDLNRFSSSYLAIVGDLFGRRSFDEARLLAEKVYRRLCKSRNNDKKIFYKNAYVIGLASNQGPAAKRVVDSGASCAIPGSYVRDGQVDILKYLGEKRRWSSYEKYINYLAKDRTHAGELIFHYNKLREAYINSGNLANAQSIDRKINSLYQRALRSGKKIPVQSLHVVAAINLKDMENTVKSFHRIKFSFPEQKFNAQLTKKIQLLDRIASLRDRVVRIKSGMGIIRADQLVVEAYQRLVYDIKNFVPAGKPPEYVKTFKRSMAQVEATLLAKSKTYLNAARSLINKGKVLSPYNHWFVSEKRLPINIEYYYRDNGITMDRGGRR